MGRLLANGLRDASCALPGFSLPGRFVEHENLRIANKRPRKPDALTLPSRERNAPFAYLAHRRIRRAVHERRKACRTIACSMSACVAEGALRRMFSSIEQSAYCLLKHGPHLRAYSRHCELEIRTPSKQISPFAVLADRELCVPACFSQSHLVQRSPPSPLFAKRERHR